MYSHLRSVAARRITTQLSKSTRRITTITYQKRTQISTKRVPVPVSVTPTCSQTSRLIHTSKTSLQKKMDTSSSTTTKADPASPAPSAPAAPTGSNTSSTSPGPGSTSPISTSAPEASTTNPTPTSTSTTTIVTDVSEAPTITARPSQFGPEVIDDSNPLSDPLSVESQRLANAGAPLPLPSPETATPISPDQEQPKVVTVNGQAVALDNLGPMVVHKDGTISRIANWHEMTEIEKQTTLRVLGKRNQLRLGNLREGRVNGEGM